jgi:hypothetical protein
MWALPSQPPVTVWAFSRSTYKPAGRARAMPITEAVNNEATGCRLS